MDGASTVLPAVLPADRLLLLALALATSAAAYELARFAVAGALDRLLKESVRRFVERHRVQIDVFKYSGQVLVREELLNDLEVQEGILQAARAGESAGQARARVEEYIDEIIPRFSLTAYYKFGYALARFCLRLVYRIEHDQASFQKLQQLPANASVMFLMNHRSNADYLLVAVALARRVAISFAIGEWARVFPLDLLFKLFGGYFLRRNFRDPLYHTVLRRYLQLIVRKGVTQGLFPEGKLTRDGRLGEPKIGLLDAMVSMAAEPGFDREIVFVPVGLNFDRVLEDTFQITEERRDKPPTRLEKTLSLARIVARAPVSLVRNALRAATGRLQRFGYASVSFGDPVTLDSFARRHGLDARTLAALPKEERRPLVKQFADEMMGHIAQAMPATPVPLTCRALVELGGEAGEVELAARIAQVAKTLQDKGVPVVLGREFEAVRRAQARLDREREEGERRRELAAVDQALIDHDRAEECARIGLARLAARRIVELRGGRVRVLGGKDTLVRYYAAALAALDLPEKQADSEKAQEGAAA